jgi:hypothetical protein
MISKLKNTLTIIYVMILCVLAFFLYVTVMIIDNTFFHGTFNFRFWSPYIVLTGILWVVLVKWMVKVDNDIAKTKLDSISKDIEQIGR